jgi:rubrerythrin
MDKSMESKYSAYEVLEIAEKIEHNGAAFYNKAAEIFEDEQIRDVFLNLAEWEVRHEKIFADMRRQINKSFSGAANFDPETYMAGNAKLMASLAVFAIRPDPGEILIGLEDKEDVFKKALKLEKDTIVFYRGLKSFAENTDTIEQIDKIIEEEQKHIRIINQSLEQL